MKNKFLITLISLIILTQPVLVSAQPQYNTDCAQGTFGNLIPCNGTDECPCTFAHLLILIDNILKFMIYISFPLAIITFSWAGFKFMIDRGKGSDAKDAKEMMRKVVIGFVFILASWLIVKTILNVLFENSNILN